MSCITKSSEFDQQSAVENPRLHLEDAPVKPEAFKTGFVKWITGSVVSVFLHSALIAALLVPVAFPGSVVEFNPVELLTAEPEQKTPEQNAHEQSSSEQNAQVAAIDPPAIDTKFIAEHVKPIVVLEPVLVNTPAQAVATAYSVKEKTEIIKPAAKRKIVKLESDEEVESAEEKQRELKKYEEIRNLKRIAIKQAQDKINLEKKRMAQQAIARSNSNNQTDDTRENSKTAKQNRADKTEISPNEYASLVSAQINAHKIYPVAAQDQGAVGVVNIAFVIGRAGRVTSASVARSSGNDILDAAARQTLLSISAPPPPGGRFVRTVPIRYNIR